MDLPTHLLLYISCIILSVESLMFNLEPNNRKCLKEEIHKGVLVTGEYEVRLPTVCIGPRTYFFPRPILYFSPLPWYAEIDSRALFAFIIRLYIQFPLYLLYLLLFCSHFFPYFLFPIFIFFPPMTNTPPTGGGGFSNIYTPDLFSLQYS
jgi:hypothetical protein